MPPRKKASMAAKAQEESLPSKSSAAAAKSPTKSKQSTLSSSTSATTAQPTRANKQPSFTASPVPHKPRPIPTLHSHPGTPPALIFTHGAGGDHTAPAMQYFSQGFAALSPITMFAGPMHLANRAGMFATVLAHERDDASASVSPTTKLAFGGRSMGARAAVVAAAAAAAADTQVKMLVLASYPLVSPAGDVRDAILRNVAADVDVLFLSGDGDGMCALDHLDRVRGEMQARSWMVCVRGADHGMNLRGGSKLKKGTEEVGKAMGRVAARWMDDRDAARREMTIWWSGEKEAVEGEDDWRAERVEKKTGPGTSGGIKRFFAAAEAEREGATTGTKGKRAKK